MNVKREEIQKEIQNAILTNKFFGIVNVSPRVGKTKPTIDALNNIKSTKLEVLILAPKVDIFKSWKKEFQLWGLNSNITVSYCWSNSLKKDSNFYDLIIADECHDYNLKVMYELRNHQRKGTKILGLTGTLTQDKEFHLNNLLSLIPIYTYTIKEAIDDGIVSDYNIFCIGCELDNTEKYIIAGTEEAPFYQTELQAYTYWDKRYKKEASLQRFNNLKFLGSKRLNIIYNSKTKLEKTKELLRQESRCLIFTGRKEIADQITDAHHSDTKENLELFIDEKINHLSCVSMISMGITIPNLKSVIFNQLKSVEALAVQQAMRAMNLQKKEKAKIQIVYLKNTQDEKWLKSALQGFEKDKIKFV